MLLQSAQAAEGTNKAGRRLDKIHPAVGYILGTQYSLANDKSNGPV